MMPLGSPSLSTFAASRAEKFAATLKSVCFREQSETRLERAKPWRVDAVIVVDQNALRCHNSLRHYHTLARGRKGRGDRRASETNVRAGFSVNSNRGLMLCVCHTERSEVSLLGTENVDKGFFAEFTLSP